MDCEDVGALYETEKSYGEIIHDFFADNPQTLYIYANPKGVQSPSYVSIREFSGSMPIKTSEMDWDKYSIPSEYSRPLKKYIHETCELMPFIYI